MNGGDEQRGSSFEGDSKGRGEGDKNQVSPVRSGSRDGRYSRALQRGLQVVACFTVERPLLGVRELAAMLEMSPATTHRYVSALAAQGYLEQDSASSKYRLSLGAIDLGMAALSATGLCLHALPHIEELARSSGFAVQIGVLDGSEVLLVAALPPKRRDQRDPGCDARAGSRLPVHRTSLGKVLLAHLPTASSDGELVPGACAIAAPVRDESGDVVAAVNLVAQHGTVELTELARWFEGQLLTTAERISTRLGWRGEGR